MGGDVLEKRAGIRSIDAARPRLFLLSGFRLERGDVAVDPPLSSKRLVAYLAVNGGGSRAVVAGRLWSDVSEDRAHASLRTAIWRVRRTIADVLEIKSEHLSLARSVIVDVRALEDRAQALRRCSTHLSEDNLDLAGLIGGELLPGWCDDWVLFERERVRQLQFHALESLSRRLVEQGRHGEALETALHAVRLEPLRESGHGCVLAAHLAEGNVAEAVRHYATVRRLFSAELGLAPTTALTDLLATKVPIPRLAELVTQAMITTGYVTCR